MQLMGKQRGASQTNTVSVAFIPSGDLHNVTVH